MARYDLAVWDANNRCQVCGDLPDASLTGRPGFRIHLRCIPTAVREWADTTLDIQELRSLETNPVKVAKPWIVAAFVFATLKASLASTLIPLRSFRDIESLSDAKV